MASLPLTNFTNNLSLSRLRVQIKEHTPHAGLNATVNLGKASFLAKGQILPQRQRRDVTVKAGLFDFITKPLAENKQKKQQQLREDLKQELLRLIDPLERGAEATEGEKDAVEQVAQKLEALNPTRSPLSSSLLNGKWELEYTTSESILGANRPKFLRPQGPIYQCIDTSTLQARNIETWPFFNQVQATLTPVDSSLVDVKFDYFKILGIFDVKSPDSARGQLEITYLDEDLRISRGNRGNLFVLTMDDPTYTIQKPSAK